MAKRRFMSRGAGWSNGIVELDREGREFDTESEADLIAGILRDAVGGLVIEVPTAEANKQALQAVVLDDLAGLIDEEVEKRLAALQVERLSSGNLEEEMAAAAENEAAREASLRDHAQEEAKIRAEKAGARLDWMEERKEKNAQKKRGRPAKSNGKVAENG